MAAPEDTPWNRFVTFAVTAVLFGSFGLATGAILLIGGDDGWKDLEAPAAEARERKLDAYRAALPAAASVSPEAAVAALAGNRPVKSSTLVPVAPPPLSRPKSSGAKHDPAESELLDL